jgi:hypothetical protein
MRAARRDMIVELASDRVTDAADAALHDYRTFHGWLQPIFVAQLEAELADLDNEGIAAYYTERLGTSPAGWDASPADDSAADEHWSVRFYPQAWIGDHAVEVDGEGDSSWDVTAELAGLTAEERLRAASSDEAVLDHLRHLPTCPRWIREWPGPFRLELVRRDEPRA